MVKAQTAGAIFIGSVLTIALGVALVQKARGSSGNDGGSNGCKIGVDQVSIDYAKIIEERTNTFWDFETKYTNRHCENLSFKAIVQVKKGTEVIGIHSLVFTLDAGESATQIWPINFAFMGSGNYTLDFFAWDLNGAAISRNKRITINI